MKVKTTDKSLIYNIIQKLKFESANTIFYGSAILSVAYIYKLSLQSPPEALLAIATGIGVESISAIIQRLKSNEKIDDKEIIETVKTAIKDSGIESELQKNEFKSQISKILQNLDFIKYYTQEGEYKLANILAEQYCNHNLIVKIQQDLKDLREVINNLARKDQSEEIISLLRTLIKIEENSNDISSNQLKEIEEHYLSWLVRQHNRLDLRGIKEAGSIPTIPLEQVYVALRGINSSPAEREESKREIDRHLEFEYLNMPPLEYRQRRSEFLANAPWMMSLDERDRTSSQDHSKQERMNLGEVFQKYRWLVLLGDPGSGKTTLVRWLTLRLAQAALAKQNQISVPANQVEPKAKETDSPIALGSTRLPIILRVSDYAEAKNKDENLLLIDFLGDHGWMGKVPTYNHNSSKCGEKIPPELLNELFKHALKEQQAVVFLDGLDELSENTKRENIVAAIESFIHDWIKTPDGFSPFDDLSRPWELSYSSESPLQQGGNQIIITSRIAGYHDSPLSGYVPHYTIEAMQPEAINQFCDAWTLAVHKIIAKPDAQEKDIEQNAQKQASSLKDAIHLSGNTSVTEMSSNPLLLTILAMIHHTTKAKLPERRIELYQKAVKILIEEWRESGLNEDEVLYILGPIAEYIHENYQSGLIPIHVLKEKIKIHYACYKGYKPQNIPLDIDQQVEQFIKTLQEKIGIIAGRGEEYYGFLHLTFQEYFAARQLVRDEIGAQKRLLDRIHNSRWREPIILALAYATKVWGIESREKLLFGLLESEDQLSDIYPHAPLLIADCIPEMVSVPGRLISPLAEKLLEIYSDHQGRGQYKDLQQRIETAFHQLRNEKNEHHCFIVDQILVKAIKTPEKIHSNSRYAAAKLIFQFNWHSLLLAEALVAVYPDDSEEWNWPVDRARRQLANNFPVELPIHLLPFRQKIVNEPKYIEVINNNFVLQQIFWVLCNGQMEITFNPSKIACEPFLANDLLKILNNEIVFEEWIEELYQSWKKKKVPIDQISETFLILVFSGKINVKDELDYSKNKNALMILKCFSEVQFHLNIMEKDKFFKNFSQIVGQKLKILLQIEEAVLSFSSSIDPIPSISMFLAKYPDLLSQVITTTRFFSASSDQARVLSSIVLSLSNHPDLLSQVITTAPSFLDPSDQARALSSIAPTLSNHPDLLSKVITTTLSMSPLDQVRVLVSIAPALSNHPDLLSQVITITCSMSFRHNQVRVLSSIAPSLSNHPDLLSKVIKNTLSMSDSFDQSQVLVSIAPALSNHPDLLSQVISTTRSFSASSDQARVLISIAPTLSNYPDLLSQVITTAPSFLDPSDQARVLISIAPTLSNHPDSLSQVITTALSMLDPSDQAFVLIRVAPTLINHPDLLSQVITTALSMSNSYNQAGVLSSIAPSLSKHPNLLSQVITTTLSISDSFDQAQVLVSIAPALSNNPDLLSQVIIITRSLSNSSDQAMVLKVIAPALSNYPDLLSQVITTTRSFSGSSDQLLVLREIAPFLSEHPDLLSQVISIALSISASSVQAQVLSSIGPDLSEHPDLLSQVITITCSMFSSYDQAKVLSSIAPSLSNHPDLLSQVITITCSMSDSYNQAQVLVSIAPALSNNPDLLSQVIIITRSLSNSSDQAMVLKVIAPALSKHPDLLTQVITITCSMSDSYNQAQVLVSIAPALSNHPDLLSQVITITCSMSDSYNQAQVLKVIAPTLSNHPDLLSQVIKNTLSVSDSSDQAMVLREIVPTLSNHPDLLSQVIKNTLSVSDSSDQAMVLNSIIPNLNLNSVLIKKIWICIYQYILIGSIAKKSHNLYSSYFPEVDWENIWDSSVKDSFINRIKKSRTVIQIPNKILNKLILNKEYQLLNEILPYICLEDKEETEVIYHLTKNLNVENQIINVFSALLLAENGYLSKETLEILSQLLQVADERTIYRIQLALMPETPFKLGQIGVNTLIKLEELKIQADENDDFLSFTILFWTYQRIDFDDPEIYRELLDKLFLEENNSIEETILNSSSNLNKETFDLLLSSIAEMMDSPKVILLLNIEANYLENNEVSTEKTTFVKNLLKQLLKVKNDKLLQSALTCLSMIKIVQAEDLNLLKSLINNKPQRNQAIDTFGFLLRNGSVQQKQDALAYLVSIYKNPNFLNSRNEILANWVKIHISQLIKNNSETYAYEILDLLTDIEETDNRIILESLIHAGTNHFVWELNFHQKIVEVSETLIRHDPSLVSFLIENMSQSLRNQNGDSWHRARILLGIGVAVAKNMPTIFPQKAKPYSLIELLIKATKNIHSFNVRRFAFTILSHLEEFTAVMIPALIRSISDVQIVHQDALIAVTRFQKIDDAALPKLTEELYHQRATVAYAIGKCLVSIGQNPKTSVEQRKFIRRELRNAVQDKRSKRPVYILKDREIVYLGELDHLFYALFSDFIEGRKNK